MPRAAAAGARAPARARAQPARTRRRPGAPTKRGQVRPLRRGQAKVPVKSQPGRVVAATLTRARVERLLDGLLRGRLWIGLVAVLLFGIVFLNVSLLQRDRNIAKGAESVTELKRANERLRVEVARLGSSERIQRAAAGRGFALPGPAEVTYLRSRGEADASKALARLRVGAGSGDAAATQPTSAEAPAEPPTAAQPPPSAPAPTADAGQGQPGSAPTTATPAPPPAVTPLAR